MALDLDKLAKELDDFLEYIDGLGCKVIRKDLLTSVEYWEGMYLEFLLEEERESLSFEEFVCREAGLLKLDSENA